MEFKYLFFDPTYYHENGKMQTSASSDFTVLNNRFGQAKSKRVYLNQYNFLDSYWYNPPFLKGDKLETYSVLAENY